MKRRCFFMCSAARNLPQMVFIGTVIFAGAMGAQTLPSRDREDAPVSIADSGTNGDVFMTSPSPFTTAGVQIVAKSSWPSLVAKTGGSTSSSGFSIFNASNLELMSIRSDGWVGIGTGSAGPTAKLQVEDLANNVQMILSSGDEPGLPNSPTLTLMRKDGNDVQVAKLGLRLDSADSNKFKLLYGTTAGFTSTLMTITTNGRLGVGPATPAAKLHLEDLTADAEIIVASGDEPGVPNSPTLTLMRKDGNDAQAAKFGLQLDSDDLNKFKLLYGTTSGYTSTLLTVDTAGNLSAAGNISATGTIFAKYQDVAEWVPATSDMLPGTVVILNPEVSNEVMPSSDRYDVRVAGVVSGQPGLLLGEAGESKEQIATTGRVRVRVDATAAPIRIGDLLVTSDNPGHAMRSDAIEIQGRKFHQPGTIIGKALEPLASGEGEILVLLSLQ